MYRKSQTKNVLSYGAYDNKYIKVHLIWVTIKQNIKCTITFHKKEIYPRSKQIMPRRCFIWLRKRAGGLMYRVFIPICMYSYEKIDISIKHSAFN